MSVETPEVIVTELRCPVGPKALLAKVRSEGRIETYDEWNLLELDCRDCKRTLRKQDPTVVRVLHRFNVLGELVESAVDHEGV